MDILEKMKTQCKDAGYFATKNIEKIARAKAMMFGEEEWYRCPCDGKNAERFCISELCRSDIQNKGICHCNCYSKTDVETKIKTDSLGCAVSEQSLDF